MTSSTSSSSRKHLYGYLAATVGCGTFSVIYEHFSHGVYSPFMVYLFAVPLLLGVVPSVIGLLFPRLDVGGSWQNTIHAFAVVTLTVASMLQGVVDIYGTTSQYIVYYVVFGAACLLLSGLLWIVQLFIAQPAKTEAHRS